MAKHYPMLEYSSKFNTLTHKELLALYEPMGKEGREAEWEKNRRIIWDHNLLLVNHLIKKHRMDEGIHEDTEDLIMELSQHLWDIIPKFKPEKGYRFSTFAMLCLRNKAFSFLTKVGKYQKRFELGSYTLEDNKSADILE